MCLHSATQCLKAPLQTPSKSHPVMVVGDFMVCKEKQMLQIT